MGRSDGLPLQRLGQAGVVGEAGGDEFGELGGQGGEQAPLAGGPADGKRVQGWDGDSADQAGGGIGDPGQGGQDGMTDAEFGEQDRGVPVGDAGGCGKADPQAGEVVLQSLPGGGAFWVGEVSDGGQIAGPYGVPAASGSSACTASTQGRSRTGRCWMPGSGCPSVIQARSIWPSRSSSMHRRVE